MSLKGRLCRSSLVLLVAFVLCLTSSDSTSAQVVSLDAADVATFVSRCGAEEPADDTLRLAQEHICSHRRTGTGEVIAFEENRWFVYALTDMLVDSDAQKNRQSNPHSRWLRRIVLLKPSTLVVEDVLKSSDSTFSSRCMFRSSVKPEVGARGVLLTDDNKTIRCATVLPRNPTLKLIERPARDGRPAAYRVELTGQQQADESRFLNVFQLNEDGKTVASVNAKVATIEVDTELTVTTSKRVFRFILPSASNAAGKIQITAADGSALVPNRVLPSGVMPHGVKGAALMERWDAPYRRDRMPGWDVGRSCSYLVQAVEDKTFKPGRAIVFGCGSGTNAIYLASQGFEVTGVDVAPSALAVATRKANEAGVEVNWVLADVVTLPDLPPYDLVFDRGCYHHICQYDSPGYVETLRRLSHEGTQALILAGSPADGGKGGPPRIKETTIRNDFSTLFDFEWLKDIHFESRNADAKGPSAWSIHLRRKGS